MSEISLDLPSNVLYEEEQVLKFDKIATFIGGNGSGKSTILKSIFDAKLQGTKYEEHKIVCFSSGQNESYSTNFSEYLKAERAQRKALNLDCFYYDKLWAMLLIFIATTSKQNGEVRTFLKQNNYINENEYDEDESTKLSFKVKIDEPYTNLVQQSLEDERNGDTDVITTKAYYQTLSNFINSLVRENYEFKESIELETIQLDQDKLSSVSFETDEESSFDSKVMFFTQAADNDYFIVKNSFELTFEKDGEFLHLNDLSDGEYQLLFLYSLIDLFDSEHTLFLLDEADSHLHYKNIDRLWSVYNNAQGSIITTTHLLDSIAKAGSKRLRIIEEGKVEQSNDSSKILRRLESLSELTLMQHKIATMYKNVVLMDNIDDWEIFKLLVKRKLSEVKPIQEINDYLSSFVCLSVPSGFHEGKNINEFADNKINWLKNFEKVLNDSFIKGLKTTTEKVFLICDGDDFPITLIGAGKYPLEVNGHSFVEEERVMIKRRKNKKESNSEKNNSLSKRPLLSWKRREIKHYLLSFTALSDSVNIINEELPSKYYLSEESSGDYIDADKKIYNNKLARIKSNIIKDIVDPHLIKIGKGFCIEKTKAYVDTIPKEEISEDIVNMYNYLVGENE